MRDAPVANPWLAAVEPSPIGETKRWVLGRNFPADRPLIDLSQAVPGYPPAMELRRHLGDGCSIRRCTATRRSSACRALREDYAAHLSSFYGAPSPPDEVGITSGCNQAFCLAMMSIAQAGDEVILPRPHYFNHDMWLRMQGIAPVSLDFRPGSGAVPHAEDAAQLITPEDARHRPDLAQQSDRRGLSARHHPRLLRAGEEAWPRPAARRDLQGFPARGQRPHELFGDPAWRGTLVHLYSFSKVFALTGYRVGGVTAGAALMAEIEKAMDCVSICPPRLGQEAALYGLRNLLPWARKNTEGLKARADLLGGGLARSNRWRLVSIGAYFAYVEHPFAGERSTAVSKRLADEENLLTIPGDMFGAGQERFVRIAFANVSDDKIPAVLERLERFGAA